MSVNFFKSLVIFFILALCGCSQSSDEQPNPATNSAPVAESATEKNQTNFDAFNSVPDCGKFVQDKQACASAASYEDCMKIKGGGNPNYSTLINSCNEDGTHR